MTREEFIAWRKSLGLTQEDMADRLQLSRRTVIHYERGSRRIPDEVAAKAGATSPDALIRYVTHPYLYEKSGKLIVPGPRHPDRVLASVRYVEMHGALFPIKEARSWPASILTDPAYLAAVAKVEQQEKTAKDWKETTLAEMYGDALPGETVAQYLARTKI